MNRSLLAVVAGLLCALASVVHAAEPWDAPAFSVAAKTIAEAASKLPPPEQEAAYEILLSHARLQYDEQGRCQSTFQLVYRVLTAAGVEHAGFAEAAWAPWYQERPVLRARVITPNGEQHELDAKHLAEVPTAQGDYVLTDRKQIRAPLPGIRVGAIVEREIVTKDTRPFFPQGTTERIEWDSYFPQRLMRLTVDAPASLPLRYEARGCKVEPQRSESEGRVTLVFESSSIPPRKVIEGLQPPQTPRLPNISLSTGKSWEEIARGYHQVVEKQLGDAKLKTAIGDVLERGGSREQVAAALLQRMHAVVQYTGLSFGEAAIVPRPPLETLSRKFGDCKDQSTLLVAMLRAAGIEANVALLHAGSVEEIPTALPGLGAFNHAIVYVPGEPALWIDPTAPFARVGELPMHDQGKPALIASASSTGLVRTPEAPAAENRRLETYVVDFSDPQAAKVTVTLESAGTIAHDRRAFYAQQTEKNLRKAWEDYFQQAYRVGSLSHFSYSDPKDLTACRTQVEAKGISFAGTEVGAIACSMQASSLLERLPPILYPGPAGGEKVPGVEPRKTPLVLLEKHVSEMVSRYVPPPGFVARDLPENKEFSIGPANVSRTFAVGDDRVLTVRFQLDTGDGRFTAEEVESLREALGQIGADAALGPYQFVLNFEMAAARASVEGRHREALAEFGRLLAAQPNDAALHTQYGFALLRAGFGEAARAEVRRATELAPQSATAWHQLGSILTFDLVGHPFHPGCDCTAARAAYEKGLEIDPDRELLNFDYALLLERDPRGVRHTSDVDREACLAAYAKARGKFPANEKLRLNHEFALLDCGKFEELAREAAKKPHTVNDQCLLMAAVAVTKGAAAAIRQADSLPVAAEARREVLLAVGDYLYRARKYALAAELWEAGAKGNAAEQRIRELAENTKSFKSYEDNLVDDSRPERVVQQLYVAMQLGGRELRESRQLFADPPPEGRAIEEWDALNQEVAPRGKTLDNVQISPARRADMIANVLTFAVEGDDDTGYRVLSRGQALRQLTWYVVKRDDGYKIASVGTNCSVWGEAALRALADEKPDVARQYLRWAYDVLRGQVSIFDPFSGIPFARLWSMSDAQNIDDVRLAATALAANSPRHEEHIKQLMAMREAQTDNRRKLQIDRALAFEPGFKQLSPADLESALAAADRLLAVSPKSQRAVSWKAWLLEQLGRGDEAEALVRKRLEESPKDRGMQQLAAMHLTRLGKFKEAQELLRPLATSNKTGTVENSLAWNALFTPPVTSAALDDAKRGAELSPTPGIMHTLAAVYAELDMPEEAYKTLLQVIESRANQIDHTDYVVLGRAAEAYGLPAIAAQCYRQVQREQQRGQESSWHLAQLRLKGLESK